MRQLLLLGWRLPGQRALLQHRLRRGSCPRPKPGLVTICLVECGSDSECRGSGKCCSMGCHVHCTQPVPGKGTKPGVCPKRRVLHTFAPCNSSCSDDTDCPHREKCCFTGCGRGCLPPDKRITDAWLAAAQSPLSHLTHSSTCSPVPSCFPSQLCLPVLVL
uniref:WAP domain-containing protein n=1 Tax=Falco tinnunculus TaxID=100819 RepID=A0A8C4TX30_FALTI